MLYRQTINNSPQIVITILRDKLRGYYHHLAQQKYGFHCESPKQFGLVLLLSLIRHLSLN